MVHIAPHLALFAPAFGAIGRDIEFMLEHRRTGIREGVVFKTSDPSGMWLDRFCKVVRSDFTRMDDDWNKRDMSRNEVQRPKLKGAV